MSKGACIGIEGSALGVTLGCATSVRTGIGRYIWELCIRLDVLLPDCRFVVYSRHPVELPVRSARWQLRCEEALRWRRLPRVLWTRHRCARLCAEDGVDVFWAPAHFLPLFRTPPRTILTIHDLWYLVNPATMGAFDYALHKLYCGNDLLRSDRLVATTEATSNRVKRTFRREPAAIAPPAVADVFSRQSAAAVQSCLAGYGVRKPYLLAVGTHSPRKNFPVLCRAFLGLRERGLLQNTQLVLVGGRERDSAAILKLAGRARGAMIVLGFVPDCDLASFYSGAAALIAPSIYEGFGIPIAEARACGTPVVATDIPEMREAGGPDQVYVPPTEAGIADGIVRVLGSQSGIQAGSEAAALTWDGSAAIMADLIQSLLPAYSTQQDASVESSCAPNYAIHSMRSGL